MILMCVFAVVLLELVIVSWLDLRIKKISNKWILVNVSASVILHVLFPSLYPHSWEVLIFPIGFVLIGFLLFLLNIMGAGDSKFLASLFLIVPLEFQLLFFEKLVLSTAVTGTLLILFKLITQKDKIKTYLISRYWAGLRETIRSRFSYAPVVALAWLLLGFNLWK